MTVSNSDLKSRARACLVGHYGTAIAALVLIDMLSFLLSAVFSYSGLENSLLLGGIAWAIILLLTLMLEAGSIRLYLNLGRQAQPNVMDVFWFLGNQPDKIILLLLRIFLRLFLRTLPLTVLTIAAFYCILHFLITGLLRVLIQVLFAIVWVAALFAAYLPYALAFHFYTDHPEWPVQEDLLQSQRIMEGKKAAYTKLLLSFFGLFLLVILSFGIGALWLSPYIKETTAQFYLTAEEPASQMPLQQTVKPSENPFEL